MIPIALLETAAVTCANFAVIILEPCWLLHGWYNTPPIQFFDASFFFLARPFPVGRLGRPFFGTMVKFPIAIRPSIFFIIAPRRFLWLAAMLATTCTPLYFHFRVHWLLRFFRAKWAVWVWVWVWIPWALSQQPRGDENEEENQVLHDTFVLPPNTCGRSRFTSKAQEGRPRFLPMDFIGYNFGLSPESAIPAWRENLGLIEL